TLYGCSVHTKTRAKTRGPPGAPNVWRVPRTGRWAGGRRPPPPPAAPETGGPATPQRPAGNAVFPTAIPPKYSNESAGRARMHTCLEQYNANKATNANGGLKWIQKGGGYYSECTKQLKG